MPQLDKTGPMGQGSQTGRKQGSCSSNANETMELAPGRRGMGRGLRNRINNETESVPAFGRGRGKGRNTSKGRACGMGRGRNSQMQ